jgi:hypothetical protein
MTKRKSKSRKSTIKATAAKGAVKRSSTAPAAAATPPMIVLGFDEQQKAWAARFIDVKPDLVAQGRRQGGVQDPETNSPKAAGLAKNLPLRRLYPAAV